MIFADCAVTATSSVLQVLDSGALRIRLQRHRGGDRPSWGAPVCFGLREWKFSIA